ncbi:hypothetical protein Nepgr_033467 [Nepenthes gracilis]|uniref:MRN complex-interacting protein N-terminal domain-containing protein n=1 Tax=Nepenthes gracilis TaxID=150966 RepID=A0AAD3TKP1_NEPGR|nr:hypothetical protein Nepgr_033467 [Nepenthes gracilis]
MSALLIALQCCQCSTMQVKQQKKSSNKWTCVVCNQKQSVRKVFAQGCMAKDVRQFVQSFNMSRKFAEETVDDDGPPFPKWHDDESLVVDQTRKKKRTDWIEYIDEDKDPDLKLQVEKATREDTFDPKIVTELPEQLFKKPKSKNYGSGSAGFGTDNRKASYNRRPISSTRNEYCCYQGKDSMKCQPISTTEASRWDERKDLLRNVQQSCRKGLRKRMPMPTKRASKWSEYKETEADDEDVCPKRDKDAFADDLEFMSCDGSELLSIELRDQRVEEDIHPDFN